MEGKKPEVSSTASKSNTKPPKAFLRAVVPPEHQEEEFIQRQILRALRSATVIEGPGPVTPIPDAFKENLCMAVVPYNPHTRRLEALNAGLKGILSSWNVLASATKTTASQRPALPQTPAQIGLSSVASSSRSTEKFLRGDDFATILPLTDTSTTTRTTTIRELPQPPIIPGRQRSLEEEPRPSTSAAARAAIAAAAGPSSSAAGATKSRKKKVKEEEPQSSSRYRFTTERNSNSTFVQNEEKIKSQMQWEERTEAEVINQFRNIIANTLAMGKALHINPFLLLGIDGIGTCRNEDFGCRVVSPDMHSYNVHSHNCVYSYYSRCLVSQKCNFFPRGSLNGLKDLVRHMEEKHKDALNIIPSGINCFSTMLDPNDFVVEAYLWPFILAKTELEFNEFKCDAIIMQQCIAPCQDEKPLLFVFAVLINRNRKDYLVNVAFMFFNDAGEILQPRGMDFNRVTEPAFDHELEFYKTAWQYGFAYQTQAVTDFALRSAPYAPILPGYLISVLFSFNFSFLRYSMPDEYLANAVRSWEAAGVTNPRLLMDLAEANSFIPSQLQGIVAPAVPLPDGNWQKAIIFEMRDNSESRLAVFTPIVEKLLASKSANLKVEVLKCFNPKVIILVPTLLCVEEMYRWFLRTYENSSLNVVRSSEMTSGEERSRAASQLDIWIGTPGGTFYRNTRREFELSTNNLETVVVWRCDRIFNYGSAQDFKRMKTVIASCYSRINIVLQYNDRYADVSEKEKFIFSQTSMPDVLSLGPILTDGLKDLDITIHRVPDNDGKDVKLRALLEEGTSYRTQYVFVKSYESVNDLRLFCSFLPEHIQLIKVENRAGGLRKEGAAEIQRILNAKPAVMFSTTSWLGADGFPTADRVIMYGIPRSITDFLGTMHACVGSDGKKSKLDIIEPIQDHPKGLLANFTKYVKRAQGDFTQKVDPDYDSYVNRHQFRRDEDQEAQEPSNHARDQEEEEEDEWDDVLEMEMRAAEIWGSEEDNE